MQITPTALPEVLLIEPKVFSDSRGFFYESFQTQRYSEAGLPPHFVQDNFSHSQKNTLRGLHYQLKHPQGKLVYVTRGKVLDIAVDIRVGSPTFGQWVSVILDAEKPQQFYIPPGFAHGFCVLSDEADFFYKCTDYYHPEDEQGIIWNDSDLNINWPTTHPLLSAKDQLYRSLQQMPEELLPKYL